MNDRIDHIRQGRCSSGRGGGSLLNPLHPFLDTRRASYAAHILTLEATCQSTIGFKYSYPYNYIGFESLCHRCCHSMMLVGIKHYIQNY